MDEHGVEEHGVEEHGVDEHGVEGGVRAICMALPEVSERVSHGTPAFYVKKQFVMVWPHGHHDHRFPHLWCAAPAGAQEGFIAGAPERFFRPPYVGARGWLGVRLDGRLDWDELRAICEDAYRTVAPRKLLAVLDAMPHMATAALLERPGNRSAPDDRHERR